MFFQEKNDTNIDKEFGKEKKKFNLIDFLNKYKLFFIIGIAIILVLIVILFIFNKDKYYIELFGDNELTIYQGSLYIEPGYKGYNRKKDDLTDLVVINSDLDIDVIGEYKIIYRLNNKSVSRKIIVIEKPQGATYIHLLGDEVIYLEKNQEYVEPGYIVIDTVDSNLTKQVSFHNDIKSNIPGIYKVIYTVTNSSGITTTASRKVIVMDSNISLSLSNNEYTNKDISIKVHVVDNYYDYMILPDNKKITNKDYNYNISKNGTYKFVIYNKKGSYKEESITVNNIDKESPTGSCSGYYQSGKSYITVNAKDNIGIGKYVSNGVSTTSNKITLNSEVSKANVSIYDKAGNITNISCNLTKKAGSSSNNSSSGSNNVKKVKLSVASWNIGRGAKHGVKSGSLFGKKLAEYNLDIVGLQEAKPSNTEKQGSSNSFINNISKSGNFGNYKYLNVPAGNAIVSKYEFVSYDSYDLYDCGEDRGLMKTVINVNGIDISFYNTHIALPSCKKRDNQYEDVAKILANDPNPIILVADFNNNKFNETLVKYFENNYKIYAHSAYSNDTAYCDSIVVNAKGKLTHISDKVENTKSDYTDHNLVMSSFYVG